MLSQMFVMGIPPLEKVLRTVIVYGGIVIVLRLVGRRDLAQFTTFDLVVVLLLSNVVQNAIIGPDDSVTGGLLGAVVLLAANAVLVRVGTSTDMAEKVLQGSSLTLVRRGRYDESNLRRLGVRKHDVDAALREQGATGVASVDSAELRPSGTLVVELSDDAQPATHADVQSLLDRIDRLETALAGSLRPPRTGEPPAG